MSAPRHQAHFFSPEFAPGRINTPGSLVPIELPAANAFPPPRGPPLESTGKNPANDAQDRSSASTRVISAIPRGLLSPPALLSVRSFRPIRRSAAVFPARNSNAQGNWSSHGLKPPAIAARLQHDFFFLRQAGQAPHTTMDFSARFSDLAQNNV